MTLQEIAEQFGIGVSKFRQVEHAVLSQVYIVDEKYILRSRVFRPGILDRFKNEQNLLKVIRGLTPIKFPELIQTRTGVNYIINGDLLWTMYPLIEGDIWCSWWELEKLTDEQTRMIFVALSDLHTRTTGKLGVIDINVQYDFIEDIQEWLPGSGDIIESYEYKRLHQAIRAVKDFRTRLKEEDLCFIHGDCHPGNIVCRENKIVGFLDTDWARKGSYIEDLAYTLMTFMRNYRHPFKFREEIYRKFLTWYGLKEKNIKILNEHIILYVFYDFHLFHGAERVPDKDKMFKFQREFLKDICMRF